MKKKIIVFCILSTFTLYGYGKKTITQYPDIPRIDVHMHAEATSISALKDYLTLRDTIYKLCGADIAMWINVQQNDIEIVKNATNGRMLNSFSCFSPSVNGIAYQSKKSLDSLLNKGYIGYKIWYGPASRRKNVKYPYIDNQAHAKAFSLLEKEGIFLTSLHIADPNGPFQWRTPWISDPIDFWKQITGFERVLSRYPKLHIVAAHGAWLMTQDAQLDYLRYLLDTYPYLNIDITATMEYSNLSSYDNLRSFYIEYQDRLLWGTDIMNHPIKDNYPSILTLYTYWFRFLETDDSFGKEFSSNGKLIKGLKLPRQILEKIYYKNALRIYPAQIRDRYNKLGYPINFD